MIKYLLSIMTFFLIVSSHAYAVECMVGGCSGEVCANKEDAQNMMSLCMWKEEFQCYKDHGECTANEDGVCGWSQTDDLKKCIQQKMEMNGAIQNEQTF